MTARARVIAKEPLPHRRGLRRLARLIPGDAGVVQGARGVCRARVRRGRLVGARGLRGLPAPQQLLGLREASPRPGAGERLDDLRERGLPVGGRLRGLRVRARAELVDRREVAGAVAAGEEGREVERDRPVEQLGVGRPPVERGVDAAPRVLDLAVGVLDLRRRERDLRPGRPAVPDLAQVRIRRRSRQVRVGGVDDPPPRRGHGPRRGLPLGTEVELLEVAGLHGRVGRADRRGGDEPGADRARRVPGVGIGREGGRHLRALIPPLGAEQELRRAVTERRAPLGEPGPRGEVGVPRARRGPRGAGGLVRRARRGPLGLARPGRLERVAVGALGERRRVREPRLDRALRGRAAGGAGGAEQRQRGRTRPDASRACSRGPLRRPAPPGDHLRFPPSAAAGIVAGPASSRSFTSKRIAGRSCSSAVNPSRSNPTTLIVFTLPGCATNR